MNTEKEKPLQQFIKGEGLVLVVDDKPIMRKISINVLLFSGVKRDTRIQKNLISHSSRLPTSFSTSSRISHDFTSSFILV